MSALDNAVSLGMVTVTQTGGGYVVRGAETDLLIIDELEQMGAVWRDGDRAYFVATSNGAGRMESLRRNSNAAAATLAARQALAREQGVKLFDNERARQQRKVTKEIAGVYDQAMKEHEAEINRISELLQQDRPHDVDPKEWAAIVARRKNTLAELESVYDGLSDGLANAGASAQRLMNGQLAESAAISRNVAAWQLDNMSGINVSRFLAHDQAALALTGVTSFHGKYDLAAWQGVADKRKARETIRNAVARGLLTGEHPDKIARRIQGIYSGTEAGSPRKRAVRIARTETARVMSEATQETLRVANEKGVKVRNRWDATLDGKTRDSHRKVDGEIREVGEKFSNGLRRVGDGGAADSINCRCCMTPVLDGFEPDSPVRRNNETGELMPYTTFENWLKKQSGAVSVTPDKGVKVVSIDFDAPVYAGLEQKHVDAIAGKLATASVGARNLYKRFEDRFKLLDSKSKGGFYSEVRGGVNLDVALDASGKKGTAPFETWFHEFAHMSDHLAAGGDRFRPRYASVEYKGNLFGRTIKNEIDELVSAKDKELKAGFKAAMAERDVDWLERNGYIGGFATRYKVTDYRNAKEHLHDRDWLEDNGYNLRLYDEESPEDWLDAHFDKLFGDTKHTKKSAYSAIEKEIKGLDNIKKADLSDIMEGATRGSIQAGWGHGKSYWKKQDDAYGVKDAGLAIEAFAEFTSAHSCSPESLETLKKYLPQSIKVYEEILEAIEKGEIQ